MNFQEIIKITDTAIVVVFENGVRKAISRKLVDLHPGVLMIPDFIVKEINAEAKKAHQKN